MLSYITNNFVLATDINSECEQFRSREKQEIKRENEATECSRTKFKTKEHQTTKQKTTGQTLTYNSKNFQ